MHRRHLVPVLALGITVNLVAGTGEATEGGASSGRLTFGRLSWR